MNLTRKLGSGTSPRFGGQGVSKTKRVRSDDLTETNRSGRALPLFRPNSPPVSTESRSSPREASLSRLTAAGAALGHSSKSLNPAFLPYVQGSRGGITVIDLDQTLPLLRRACALVRDVVRADGVVLFVGTRDGMRRSVDKAKARLEDNGYVTHRWLPGTLTNTETLYVPTCALFSLTSSFGVEPLKRKAFLPDLVVFLNAADNIGAIHECTSKDLPTIGIIDSNTDPRLVTYPIPANVEVRACSHIQISAYFSPFAPSSSLLAL